MDKLNGMKIKGIRQSMADKLIMEDEKCQNMPGYREALLPSTYPLGVKYYIRVLEHNCYILYAAGERGAAYQDIKNEQILRSNHALQYFFFSS